jgi:hypothetical protein
MAQPAPEAWLADFSLHKAKDKRWGIAAIHIRKKRIDYRCVHLDRIKREDES